MRRLMMANRSLKRLNNKQGNTILGVLCLIAASVAAFQMSLSNSVSVNSGIKNSRILSARDTLESRIKSYSSMGTTFRSSMHFGLPVTVNAELRNCVLGGGSNPCMPGVKTPVALYYPIYSAAGVASASFQRISGPAMDNLPASESAFYDNKGNLCVPNNSGSIASNCAFFEVTTSFIATCAGGAPSCATAESISVNYMIKAATALSGSASQTLSSFPMATIELAAPDISVSQILPATAGSASSNVTISLLPSQATLSLETITSALKDLGMKGKEKIEKFALAFQQSGVTDLSKLEFLAKVGHPDPAWIKLIADSGITNQRLAYELYWSGMDWTPTLLAEVAAAIEGIKVPEVAYAIVEKKITDPAVAAQLAKNVESVTNPNVAAALIAGDHSSDPAKVQKIVSAVSHIPDPTARYIAQAGVTDPSIASQIAQIVSVVNDQYSAGWVIVSGGGDVAKTQYILDQALASISEPGTPETTVTTTTPAPATPPTSNPVEISLMPTCSTCTPVTY